MDYIERLKNKLEHPDTDADYRWKILMVFTDALLFIHKDKGDVFEILKRMKGLDDNGR